MVDNSLPEGIAPVTPALVADLGRRLRPEHIREINVSCPLRPELALETAVARAGACYAGRRNGETLFICGVGVPSILTMSAFGWLMGSTAMDRHGVWIADVSRRMLPVLHRESGARRIENWIPEDYAAARKWLVWLGFEEDDRGPVRNGVRLIHVYHDQDIGGLDCMEAKA